MKKLILLFLLVPLIYSAQYRNLIRTIERLEHRRGFMDAPICADLSQHKFILIKNQGENILRQTLTLTGQSATLADVTESKKSTDMESHVYQGDFVKTEKNVLSLRFNFMDGRAIAIPMTKMLMVGQQDNMLYLFDPISKERWLDVDALNNRSNKKVKK